MDSTKEIDWAETIAYKITNALRFSGIIDNDNYKVEQEARHEITPIVRRWCIPMERIQDWKARAEAAERELAELEARLAMLEAQAVDWDWQPTEQEWRSVTELPKEEDFYLTWDGYEIVGRWYSSYYEDDVLAWRDEFNEQQEGITHWRPLPPPPAATE